MYKLRSNHLKYNKLRNILNPYFTVNGEETSRYCNICFHNLIQKSSVFNFLKASKEQVQAFLKSFDTVVTDCDGVLWMRAKAIPGSADAMHYLQKLDKRIFYLTNNSTKSRNEFANKARHLGFKISKEQIISAAFLAAHYLKSINFRKKVYLLGSNGIGQELKAVGIRHIGVGPDHIKPGFKSMKMSELDPEVGAVLLGYDKHISYPKLMKAASYLSSKDCLFIAVDTDDKYSKAGSIVLPGVGIFLKAMETLTKRKALPIGKPHDYVRKYLKSCGINPTRTLMIGDTCSTDIELGVRCGFHTLLVLSGVTSERDVETIRKKKIPPLPDIVLPKLGDLLTLVSSVNA